MTLSIREQILVAFKGKLDAITGISGLTVERNRADPVQEFPALVMHDGGHEVTTENTGMTGYEMTVTVEGFVASASQAATGTDMNALYAKTVQAVLSDCTLGDLAVDINEQSMEVALNDLIGNAPCSAFNLIFSVQFYTKQGDPFSLAP
jgi:hypothetical protein